MLLGIKNATLISMNDKKEKIEYNQDIIIEDNTIMKIEKNIIDKYNCDKVIDASEKVIMPGLINTHAHVPMSIFRETLDGYTTQEWLTKKIWPMEDKFCKVEEDIYNASLLSFVEMIRTGCTTINDMYFVTEEIIKARKKAGIRLQTTRCLMGSSKVETDLNKIKELDSIIKKYNNDEELTFNVGIHGLYTCDREYVEKCIGYAKKMKLPIHMHFCENEQETKDIINNYGKRPVEILKELFSGIKITLAHCVKLTDNDIENLSKIDGDISVAHCPISNLRLGCGVSPIYKMKEANINISLGTDGQGSGSNLDMFETMKFAALLQKGIDEEPKEMTSYDTIKMATINGAKALGLDKEIGSIEQGKKADMIIINMDNCLVKPENDLLSEIVYNVKGYNVDTTIVNGKILMEDKKIYNINESDLYKKSAQIIDRISK